MCKLPYKICVYMKLSLMYVYAYIVKQVHVLRSKLLDCII
jgi:hypothetical protein